MIAILSNYGIFLLIPSIVFLLTIVLKIATGPYWLATNFDPSYAYLVNGLYLAKGYVPNVIEHPGTPLQMICWMICGVINAGHPLADAVQWVLRDPEFYLHVIFSFLSLLSFFSSFGLSVYVYRKTGDKLAAVLSQLPTLSFLSMKSWETLEGVLPVVSNVSPEPLLISTLNIFNICLLMSFFAKTSKDEFISTICWAFICGFGVALKFTFLPIIAIPLIVLSWRNKILFSCILGASFIVWTLPIISKYSLVWDWINSILMHSGKSNTKSIVIQSFILNWKKIILVQWVYAGVAFFAMVLVFLKFFRRKWDRGTTYLTAILAGIVLQFSAVTQYPGAHYLLPGMGLFSALLVLFYVQGVAVNVLYRKMVFTLILLSTFLGAWQAMEYRSNLANLTTDIRAFDEHIHKKYQNYVLLRYYRSSGQDAALQFGDGWDTAFRLRDEMFREYPNSYFLDLGWNNRMMNFKDRVLSNDLLEHFSGILFQADNTYDLQSHLAQSPFTVQLLERGRFENIYLLTSTTEKQALFFLYVAAIYFLQRRDFAKVLAYSLHAKDLHFQPESDVDRIIQAVTPYVQH